jgi:CheY-like chemotaxis protein
MQFEQTATSLTGNILCVDDCADRLRAVRSTLEEAGYRVRTAADVPSAAHYASRSVPDGIVAHHSIVGQPVWQQLEDAFLSVPVLEYGDPSLMPVELESCEAEARFTTWRPEMMLALLTLMLGSGPRDASGRRSPQRRLSPDERWLRSRGEVRRKKGGAENACY